MKKYVKAAFLAAIAAVVGYNVYQSQSVMNGMSDFALANVEALATPEIYIGVPCAELLYSYCIYLGPEPDDYFEWPGVAYD